MGGAAVRLHRGAPVRARHLAPLTLVLTLLAAPWTLAVYAAASLTASAQVAWAERSWRYLVQMPVAFASLHLPYGAGSLWGVVRLAVAGLGKEDSMSASKVVRAPDFSSVTELPRQGATRMQMSMLRTRYGWAAQYTAGKDVLEVACGAGLGLGWLAERARRVAAGDVDEKELPHRAGGVSRPGEYPRRVDGRAGAAVRGRLLRCSCAYLRRNII